MYHHRFSVLRETWHASHRDLVGAFGRFQEAGRLEIITCAATHALLPLMANHPPSIRAQILLARDHYRACFGRDPHTALQVWSGEHGYPGSAPYLDLHKKRFPGGHRYWSVTHPRADLAHKAIYRAGEADPLLLEHAGHFLKMVEDVTRDAGTRQSEPALVCAMYDARQMVHSLRWILHRIPEFLIQRKGNGSKRFFLWTVLQRSRSRSLYRNVLALRKSDISEHPVQGGSKLGRMRPGG